MIVPSPLGLRVNLSESVAVAAPSAKGTVWVPSEPPMTNVSLSVTTTSTSIAPPGGRPGEGEVGPVPRVRDDLPALALDGDDGRFRDHGEREVA